MLTIEHKDLTPDILRKLRKAFNLALVPDNHPKGRIYNGDIPLLIV